MRMLLALVALSTGSCRQGMRMRWKPLRNIGTGEVIHKTQGLFPYL